LIFETGKGDDEGEKNGSENFITGIFILTKAVRCVFIFWISLFREVVSGVTKEKTSCPISWRMRMKNFIFKMCFLTGMDKKNDPVCVQMDKMRLGMDRIASPINVRNDTMLRATFWNIGRDFGFGVLPFFFFIPKK